VTVSALPDLAKAPDHDLLVMRNFIHAVRDAGYVNLSTALAELVDNSIQAGAHRIDVGITRPLGDSLPEIRVLDDGKGMDRTELRDCLRFGGTIRFNQRQSFGRFGMGLPMASLSQARRVEVTAWQPGMAPQQVVMDVDQMYQSGGLACRSVPDAEAGETASGCLVVWKRCDRMEYQRLGWAEKALRRDLGRMYRYYLEDGITITVNGTAVQPVDPLMLSKVIEGEHAMPAFETLTYDLTTAAGTTSTVTVRFSVLPVLAWHGLDNAAKKKSGIVGDSVVSILRSGREIARGWYLMGGKRKENYDDWWRCEISFEPDLDEQFGITINKQGIRPTAALREALEPELESIARMLNARVRKLFENVKFLEASQASCRIATAADSDLPVIPAAANSQGPIRYAIGSEALSGTDMFHTCLKESTLSLTLNADHPAFSALYHPLEVLTDSAAVGLRTAVELLMLSFARSVVFLQASGYDSDDLVHAWSTAYGRMLRRS
jgi:hypothetical protein